MPRIIDREEVLRLLREEDGVQLVEVLPPEDYEEEHLPGAINLPLRRIEEEPKVLDPARPVIVYCNDDP
jgi:rhodanese-related sulfurtransferase